MAEISIHAQEEIAAGFLLMVFFVWAVVNLVIGFGVGRPKNHHARLRAKARRRMKRAVLQ